MLCLLDPLRVTVQIVPLFFLFPPQIPFFHLSLGVSLWNCGRGSRPWPTQSALLGSLGSYHETPAACSLPGCSLQKVLGSLPWLFFLGFYSPFPDCFLCRSLGPFPVFFIFSVFQRSSFFPRFRRGERELSRACVPFLCFLGFPPPERPPFSS